MLEDFRHHHDVGKKLRSVDLGDVTYLIEVAKRARAAATARSESSRPRAS